MVSIVQFQLFYRESSIIFPHSSVKPSYIIYVMLHMNKSIIFEISE